MSRFQSDVARLYVDSFRKSATSVLTGRFESFVLWQSEKLRMLREMNKFYLIELYNCLKK